jgi:dihydrolipoamide dehydrogenase
MKYDVIVIGGGTAGLAAYRKAKALGKHALIVEGKDFVTTCADVGCMPSKLLIAAAENMHEIYKSQHFGIEVSDIKINHEKLLNRVRSERDRFVGFVKKGAENITDKVIGYAHFVDFNTISVNGQIFESKSFVIATGSRPWMPDIFNEIKEEVLTNENVFEIEKIPNSLAVFGAGVIGLELGFAFHHLGTKVSLFNRGDKILRLNSDINNYTVKHIKENLDFVYQDNVTHIEKINEKNLYRIHYGNQYKDVEKILVATGRKSNIDKLGLEKIGIENPISLYNKETTQLGNYNIFLAGDVNSDIPLLHEAAKEGVIAGINASSFPEIKIHTRHVPLSIVFSSPQIMQVGQTLKLPIETIKGQVSFEDQGRSRVMLKNKGLLNIYFTHDTHLFIGAEMIGPDAEHVAHLLAWAIEKKSTLEEMLEFPFYHPVIEEGIRTALRDAYTHAYPNQF